MRFHALENSEFLVLGGQPLNEPLVSYGPFVMNSQDQSTPASATTAQAKWDISEPHPYPTTDQTGRIGIP